VAVAKRFTTQPEILTILGVSGDTTVTKAINTTTPELGLKLAAFLKEKINV
jgi:hypothetical protein